MSAPAKEPQPLGSTSGKRGYIRTCVRCGVTLYGVGRRAKYCPECRAEVYRERARDYKARNPEKVRAAYERRKAATWTPVYCQRCGCEITNTTHRQKWCSDCRRAVKTMRQAQSLQRKLDPAIPRPSDIARQARSLTETNDAELRLNSNVANWAGISYGQLMLKSPAAREALILAYKTAKGGTP